MIVRHVNDVQALEWGNGTSRRFLTARDGMGYTLTDTLVRAGTESRMQYLNHLEVCYCISGRGFLLDAEGRKHPITPGTMYALDQNDAHCLIASPSEDMRLICVFTPALDGHEVHDLTRDFSHY